MSLVEVTQVRREPPDYRRVRGFHIDQPQEGLRLGGHGVLLEGWALEAAGPAIAIELVAGDQVFRRIPLNMRRPDLATGYPDVPGAEMGGFRTLVALAGVSELEFVVRAVLRDQSRIDLGTIRARRRFRESELDDAAPLVSVVIPCFNQAHFLGDALASVLAQSYPHFEIVVIDDGSTDNTPAVAACFPGVRYLHQENQGLSAARNAGLRATTGSLLVFLDADDRLLPAALQSGIDCLNVHPDCAFVWGRHVYIDGRGALLRQGPPNSIMGDPYEALLRANVIAMHGAVMYRRSAFETVHGFDTSLPAAEDYDLYLRVTRRFPIASHNELVAEYRQHGGNMTRNQALLRRATQWALRHQAQHVRENPHYRPAYAAGLRACRGDGLPAEGHGGNPTKPGASLPSPDGALPVPRVGGVHWGDLRRTTPISENFGFDRGQPIDRHYIENFLALYAKDIRGCVLEVADNAYTWRFGGDGVTTSDVLSLQPQPHATIVGDLIDAPQIPSDRFDCFILTQTLHLIYDVWAALGTASRVLKPGGVLLATVPGITQCDFEEAWYWTFNARSARRLFAEFFPPENLTVVEYGNVLSAASFLYGLASEELRPHELQDCDPRYAVTVAIRAVKPNPPLAPPSPPPPEAANPGLKGGP